MSYRIQSKTINYSDGLSYVKSPLGILKLATIVSEAIVCISFPFFLDTNYWANWKKMAGAYFFYLSISMITLIGSILIFVLTLARLFKRSAIFWSYAMITTDILFGIFCLVDGIAFAVLANDYRYAFAIFKPSAFIVCSLFSFISLVLLAADLVLWSRNIVNLK